MDLFCSINNTEATFPDDLGKSIRADGSAGCPLIDSSCELKAASRKENLLLESDFESARSLVAIEVVRFHHIGSERMHLFPIRIRSLEPG